MKTEKSRQFSKSCLVIYYKLLTYVVRIFFGKVGTLKRSTKVKQSPVIYVRAWRVSSEKKMNYHELNKYQDIFEVPLLWSWWAILISQCFFLIYSIHYQISITYLICLIFKQFLVTTRYGSSPKKIGLGRVRACNVNLGPGLNLGLSEIVEPRPWQTSNFYSIIWQRWFKWGL